MAALSAYAKNLGLAFQIVDDLLDVEGDPAETGKPRLADARKTTFVSFSGVEGARELARELCETATGALGIFGPRAGAAPRAGRLRRGPARVRTACPVTPWQTRHQTSTTCARGCANWATSTRA